MQNRKKSLKFKKTVIFSCVRYEKLPLEYKMDKELL